METETHFLDMSYSTESLDLIAAELPEQALAHAKGGCESSFSSASTASSAGTCLGSASSFGSAFCYK